MSWKLGNIELDSIERAILMMRRLEKVVEIPFAYPLIFDWGRRVTTLTLEGVIVGDAKFDTLIEQERKKQPISLFAVEPYSGRYIVRGIETRELGGMVGYRRYRMELYRLDYGNLALFAPVYASSEASGYPKENAVDDDLDTTWQSAAVSGGIHWITVDLVGRYYIDKVKIFWTAAYPASYKIACSDDNVTFTDVVTDITGSEDAIETTFTTTRARYWRIEAETTDLTTPANPYTHIEIKELRVGTGVL